MCSSQIYFIYFWVPVDLWNEQTMGKLVPHSTFNSSWTKCCNINKVKIEFAHASRVVPKTNLLFLGPWPNPPPHFIQICRLLLREDWAASAPVAVHTDLQWTGPYHPVWPAPPSGTCPAHWRCSWRCTPAWSSHCASSPRTGSTGSEGHLLRHAGKRVQDSQSFVVLHTINRWIE